MEITTGSRVLWEGRAGIVFAIQGDRYGVWLGGTASIWDTLDSLRLTPDQSNVQPTPPPVPAPAAVLPPPSPGQVSRIDLASQVYGQLPLGNYTAATSSRMGATKPDNVTIIVDEYGVLSVVGGGDGLPPQAAATGRLLTTDGVSASWTDFVDGGTY